METDNLSQKSPKFVCEKCDYFTCNKKDYNKHISTLKHQLSHNGNLFIPSKIPKLLCSCGRHFKSKSGLWKHKKRCSVEKMSIIEEYEEIDLDQECHDLIKNDVGQIDNLTNLVVEIVRQNQDFQKMILEQNKQIMEMSRSGNINSNNTNCNNKTFNLQIFLNEKCKDAINITDFVDSLKPNLADLENVGEQGFVNGISSIFIKGLRQLDVYKRPIHCSDLKRETMYVKDQNSWEKENDDKLRIKQAIKNIAFKNMLNLTKWREAHPGYKDFDSKKNDQYLKIVIESAGSNVKGRDDILYDKIIKNLAKEVTIDKN